MKRESNWRFKTLESLEKEVWEESKFNSHVTKTCHQLRKKTLSNYRTEDLRIMIGQNMGLKYLVPLALETLQENILAEGDFYKGDLLNAVLSCNREFWSQERELFTRLGAIISVNRELLKEQDLNILNEFQKITDHMTQS